MANKVLLLYTLKHNYYSYKFVSFRFFCSLVSLETTKTKKNDGVELKFRRVLY